jgi:uncharacterized membrane protein
MFLQLIVYVTVFLDIPIARQVLGFFYFTFLPGFIIIKLLKLNELDGLETIVFSVGFSVAFLMLFGLFINEFLFLLGVSRPLSLVSLMITLNSLILIGTVLVYLRSEDVKFFDNGVAFPSPFALLFVCLPVLSVVGAVWVNIYGNNLLLIMIVAVSSLFSIAVICKKLSLSNVYPFAVLMIALSLLYHSSLISNYIVSFGSDAPAEFFVFKLTQNGAHWSSTPQIIWDIGYGRLNSMLSITILPTIYSTLLNLDPTWTFKMLFPIIFSFVPLCLYRFWEPNVGKKGAFIATFLFMAEATFYTEAVGLERQMIAELFFVLLLLVVLRKKMKPLNRIACFVIFSASLVVSHYALAEIFLFFLAVACISLIVIKRPSRNITVTMLVIFFTIMFSWYLYTSNAAVFDSLTSFADYVYRQSNQFFNPESRGQEVLRGLGLEAPPTIWNSFGRAFAYLTEFLIVLGFIGLITKRASIHFEKEHYTFAMIAGAVLALLILVPGLANTLGMARFYHVLLFFLAALCVLGAEFLAKLAFRQRHLQKLAASILLLSVLVPYFLFQSGLVYEVTGSQSYSLPLSKYRMNQWFLRSKLGYFDETEVLGALWLSKNVDTGSSKTYSDSISTWDILIGYGMTRFAEAISNVTVFSKESVVYLNKLNVVENVVDYRWNTTDILPILDSSKVYSNGECEIYKNR